MPDCIFVSYRRDDAAGDAGRLADHLYRRFGKDRVFLDIDTIDPGADFAQVLRASLQQTAAVLVVIGPRWMSLRDQHGVRRLDNPNDFVRLEVEASLARGVPVVPVLVQGATLPLEQDLPDSLARLVKRQAVGLDHNEFHDDAERLCARLAAMIGEDGSARWRLARRWAPVVAIVTVIALGVAAFIAARSGAGGHGTALAGSGDGAVSTPESDPRADALVAEATAQRRRNQYVDALATLARARELAPGSPAVRDMQEDVAMDWIRNVRVEAGKATFGDAIKPALAVVDSSLASATGQRRADLLAHTGWAAFLLWRDGDRRLNPADAYREALSVDPVNPYANAMLAHWILFQNDDLPHAVKLFDVAVRSGRALGAVRSLQWTAYGNASTPEANAERVRLADAMRRDGQRLSSAQAQALWSPYYFATLAGREKDRQLLLEALPPEDHINTLGWAFDDSAARDESRRRTIRYYVALLNASAGRVDQATAELSALDKELTDAPGSLRDAVRQALARLRRAGIRPAAADAL